MPDVLNAIAAASRHDLAAVRTYNKYGSAYNNNNIIEEISYGYGE